MNNEQTKVLEVVAAQISSQKNLFIELELDEGNYIALAWIDWKAQVYDFWLNYYG